jgi:hypothetical protein
MARARNIKPSFFQNDILVELPFETRLLFIGLWTLADREGRLEFRPKKIRMEIFPADDVDISKSVKELLDNGFLTVYEQKNVKVIQITNFKKHQSPHGTEKDSLLPCSKGLYIVNERKNNLVTGKFSEVQAIDNAIVSSHTVKEPLSNVNLPSHNALNPESRILNPESRILNVESHANARDDFTPDLKTLNIMLHNAGQNYQVTKQELDQTLVTFLPHYETKQLTKNQLMGKLASWIMRDRLKPNTSKGGSVSKTPDNNTTDWMSDELLEMLNAKSN